MKLTRRDLFRAAIAGAILGRTGLARAVDADTQKKVDEAIVRALDFLASAQLPEGAWRSDSYGECTAATSLAVITLCIAAAWFASRTAARKPIVEALAHV